MPERDLVETGARDQWVRIEQLGETTGSSGFPVETWTTLGTWLAARTDQSAAARERFTADQLTAVVETRWVGPYRPDLDPDLLDVPKTRRLVHRGRTYDITAAHAIGRQTDIALMTIAKATVTS